MSAMSFPIRPRLPWLFAVTLLSVAPSAVVAAPDGGTSDAAPAGMVAFFAAQSGCPAGWVAATNVQGRMIVGTNTESDVGGTVGSPLGNLEDRTHSHTFSASTNIPVESNSLVDGCGNIDGARSGTQTVTGSTDAAPTGLPFVQMLACARQ